MYRWSLSSVNLVRNESRDIRKLKSLPNYNKSEYKQVQPQDTPEHRQVQPRQMYFHKHNTQMAIPSL